MLGSFWSSLKPPATYWSDQRDPSGCNPSGWTDGLLATTRGMGSWSSPTHPAGRVDLDGLHQPARLDGLLATTWKRRRSPGTTWKRSRRNNRTTKWLPGEGPLLLWHLLLRGRALGLRGRGGGALRLSREASSVFLTRPSASRAPSSSCAASSYELIYADTEAADICDLCSKPAWFSKCSKNKIQSKYRHFACYAIASSNSTLLV